MNHETRLPDGAGASSLTGSQETTAAGLRRGAHPHWFAAATSLWAGASATALGLESPTWILLFAGGLLTYSVYRRKSTAWRTGVQNTGNRWVVTAFGLVLCAICAGGYVGWKQRDLVWAPIVAGAVITVGLFMLMEVTSRPGRTRS